MSEAYEVKPYKATLYHGSTKPIKHFDPSKGGGRFGDGLYLAEKDWADFYSKGGRQGAGHKLKDEIGYLYEFEIKTNKALYIHDEYEFASEVADKIEEAEEAVYNWGDPLKANPYFVEYATDWAGADVIVFDPKESDVLTPIKQIVVIDKSAIKSWQPFNRAEASFKQKVNAYVLAALKRIVAGVDDTDSEKDYDKEYPKAGSKVDGREVGDEIPNQDSISSTFTDYKILPGIREISMKDWGTPNQYFYAKNDLDRSKELAEEIKNSNWIAPLIIADEGGEPYILEGGHRYVALYYLDAKSFPAMVVISHDD